MDLKAFLPQMHIPHSRSGKPSLPCQFLWIQTTTLACTAWKNRVEYDVKPRYHARRADAVISRHEARDLLDFLAYTAIKTS